MDVSFKNLSLCSLCACIYYEAQALVCAEALEPPALTLPYSPGTGSLTKLSPAVSQQCVQTTSHSHSPVSALLSSVLGLQAWVAMPNIFVVAWEQNSGLHACTVSFLFLRAISPAPVFLLNQHSNLPVRNWPEKSIYQPNGLDYSNQHPQKSSPATITLHTHSQLSS